MSTRIIDKAVAAIRARSDERRREFLIEMLDYTGNAGADKPWDECSLDTLEAEYKEHHDEIWLDTDDHLAGDYDRHEADNYAEGYQAGLAFAIEALREAGFEIPPLTHAVDADCVCGAT